MLGRCFIAVTFCAISTESHEQQSTLSAGTDIGYIICVGVNVNKDSGFIKIN